MQNETLKDSVVKILNKAHMSLSIKVKAQYCNILIHTRQITYKSRNKIMSIWSKEKKRGTIPYLEVKGYQKGEAKRCQQMLGHKC